MKALILTILALSPAHAAEAPKFNVTCVTGYPTTSFVVHSTDTEVHASVIHHNGSEYAPSLSGNFTPNDLPALAERAAATRKLPMHITFTWKLASCHKGEGIRFECTGASPEQEVNGVKIRAWSVEISKVTEQATRGTYVSYRGKLMVRVDGKDVFIEMPYGEHECGETGAR